MRPTAVFGLFLLFTVSLGLSCRSGTTLAEEIALTKQAGLPTTPQELQAPLPPADKNAAPLYVQLTDLMKNKPLSEEDKITQEGFGRRPLTPEKTAQLQRAYARRSD